MTNGLNNKQIAIFGFGVEGRSLLKYLAKNQPGEIIVYDEKELADDDKRLIEELGAKFVSGKFEENDYQEISLAYRSPGVKIFRLKEILGNEIIVSSATNLFFEYVKGKTVAITGTKGKSTTAGLISEILKSTGKKVFTVGNIGQPMLDVLDQTDKKSFSVLELSSFQLQDFEGHPDVAVILPIIIDHLDYHESEQEYLKAKANLVKKMRPEDIVIASKNENATRIAQMSQARKYFFSREDINPQILQLARSKKIPEENVLAAAAFATASDLEFSLEKILESYEKLPFRVEDKGEFGGLQFFNDSASTNPISTIAAMEMMEGDYVLILGGAGKGIVFDQLARMMSEDQNLKTVYLFGAVAAEIENEISKRTLGFELKKFESLAQVIDDIKKSKPAKNILFSPAAASFDQFKNYQERGETFNQLVEKT